MSSTPPSNSYEVVRNIPNDQAKAILLSLCTNPAICAKVASYAKRLDEEASSKKRKPDSAIAICVQCDQPYYEEDNDDTSCVHHDGVLEVNYKAEVWEEISDDGPIDSSDNEEDVPEGFNWTCCGTIGTSEGCKKGPHQSDPEKSRKSAHVSVSKAKDEE
ncbi:hypothetical protein MKX07_002314 [Trichoderma sp. CBMAI-0711]|uniref:Uncharacterized protein n=1 Tax=Trichoderma parareesei TaxID=858221 RepID=A0A2H2ZF33_TRIPA|nr:hypothetical protein MKX07_002314 [Trichoderma sp. CBMAI-0711]OTA04448.1 hypothetical protein A9Z42_0050200 [Trichoderma parareesei]